jgi:hypothetical protein
MAEFQNNFPLDPPPSIGEDWATPPDRNAHNALDEARAFLQELSELIRGMTRVEMQDPSGKVYTMLGIWTGVTDSGAFGFHVVGDSNSVTVSPSVVSGMGAWATVPRVYGLALTETPAPELSTSNKRWVALRMEVEPIGDKYYDDGDTQLYRVAEGAGKLVGDVEVMAYRDLEDMEADATPATVDPSDGSVADNGIYVIPLAWLNEAGTWDQIGYSGPLGVRMCANGAFIALSPARGPGEFIAPEA